MKVEIFPLVFLVLICGQPTSSTVIRQPGDFTIAVLLPVHHDNGTKPATCSDSLDFATVVKTEAIIYAVNKLNSDPEFLDGNTLGYDIEDTCGADAKDVLEKATALLARHKKLSPVATILDLPQLLARLVAADQLQDVPVLSLGDVPSQHGDVFYLVPGQPRLPNALVDLIQEFKWSVVDVLIENDKNYQLFFDAIKDVKICVNEVFRNSTWSVVDQNSNVPLLVFADTLKILRNLPASFSNGRQVVLASGRILENMSNASNSPNAVAIQPKAAKLQDFEGHLLKSVRNNASWLVKSLRTEPWFQNCGGFVNNSCITAVEELLLSEIQQAARAIDAVYAVVYALKRTSFKTLTNKDLAKTAEVTSLTGNPIQFSENNDLFRVDYEVYKLPSKTFVGKVKTFPEGSETEIDLGKIEWGTNAGSPVNCKESCPEGVSPVPMTGLLAKCCVICPKVNSSTCGEGESLNKEGTKCVLVRLDYLRWRHPFSIVLMVLIFLFFCILVYLVNVYVRKAHMPEISGSPLATVPLLLSLFLTLILPLLPILKPSTTACNAYTFGFIQGLGIPICILISRSYSVYTRFRTEDGSLKKKVCRSDPQNVIAVVLIVVELVLSIVFIAKVPAYVVYYATDDPNVDYIECSMFNGWQLLFPFFLNIILTIVFTVKNFHATTREEDTYESHFVAISMFGYYFLSFALLIILYGVHGKIKIILICIVSLLYSLNYFMFIFFPKVYVVVFKRDPSFFSPFPLPVHEELLVLSEVSSNEEESPLR